MIEEQFIFRTISFVKGNQGWKNYVYEDSRGFLCMGYGHKLTAEEKKKYKLGDLVGLEILDDCWEKDWKLHYETAKSIEGYDKLTTQPKVALVDLTFNLGVNWVKKFPNLIQNIKKAGLAENSASRELHMSNAAQELKYKNFKENNLELSEYWVQAKGRAIRNYQLLFNDYDEWDDYA